MNPRLRTLQLVPAVAGVLALAGSAWGQPLPPQPTASGPPPAPTAAAPAPPEAPPAAAEAAAAAPADDTADADAAPVAAPAADAAALPLPAALVPQVDFWKRVYSEIDSGHGFVHDARHLDVVYATLAVPPGLSPRAAVRWSKAQVRAAAADLALLASGRRTGLTAQQARLLAAWPADVDAATLQQAAAHVRFQSGQRDKFFAGLLRGRALTPFIAQTFAAHGLPRELTALPHVESSFDLRAYSKAHAAGIFQFTAATGRLYMHMDQSVDERYDPLRATEAAARLLANNYRHTGSWPLAITAYNHGAEGMRRAAARLGTTDIAAIVQGYHSRRFGFASRNFYTELLAAWAVSQRADVYFGALPYEAPVAYDTVRTGAPYAAAQVAAALGVSLTTLRAHNPALRPAVWQARRAIPRGYALRLPHGAAPVADMAGALALLPAGLPAVAAQQPRPAAAARRRGAAALALAGGPTAAPGAAAPARWSWPAAPAAAPAVPWGGAPAPSN